MRLTTRFKLSACTAALSAAGIAVWLAPLGAAAQQPPPQKVEKIEVTGSNIKRVDTETVAPVTVITRDDIQRSGKPTIAEILHDLPQNGGQSYNETFTNSFSPGGSGIALRGLSEKSTLVLVNGRRMASYGFAQNLFDTYVDLNSIPAAAVERIEILRDGASAVYGSDAIAGVVNIILRRDFKGGELSVSSGIAAKGGLKEQRASVALGAGDPGKDRYNIMGVIDYYHRDMLQLSDRNFTKDQDFRAFPGGLLTRATVAAYYALNGASNANGRTPLATCPDANRIDASVLSPALRGTSCVYNPAAYLTLFPETDRVGFLSRGTLELTPNMSGFAEASYSKNESKQTGTPSQVANGTGLLVFNPATGGVRSIANTLAASNPSNPFGVPVNILYSFFDVGGRDTKITSDAGRVLAGLKGSVGDWDWEAALGGAQTDTKQYDYNGINANLLNTAIANGTYNFLNSAQGAVKPGDLRIDQFRDSKSKLNFADFKTTSELAQLPAGPLGFATGLEFRKESLQDNPDAQIASGNVLGRGFTSTHGDRNSSAAYVEFSVPVFKQLETQVAARYDRYSDFGAATSPKVGFKWTPLAELLVRGSVSNGFRAPTLPEATQTNALSFTSVQDPANGNRVFNIAQLSVSNNNLQPEKSKSHNLGVVWEPIKDTSVGLDYYKIRQNNLVTRDSNAFIISQAIAGNPLFVNKVVRDPATGQIVFTIRQVRNLDYVETSGFDLDFKQVLRADEYGKFTVTSNWNFVLTYKSPGNGPGSAAFDYVDSNGFAAIPRYKGTVGLTWDKSDWTSTLTYRYTNGYDQFLANGQDRVGQYHDFDLFVGYNGFKNFKLYGSIRNMLNAQPPFDASGGNLGYDFTQYDLRGRYYTAGATYSFK